MIKRTNPREISFEKHINPYADGSVIVNFGNTRVHITATVEETVPPFLRGKGTGWVTAEYNMLPGSTHSRIRRERAKGPSGRTQEIQRLIGRSLRSVVDFGLLGERSILVDCDVLVADGGTRTASITGGYVALEMAVKKLMKERVLDQNPLKERLAALSIGVNQKGEVIADLNYEEDSSCEVDMNVVMTESGNFVELQGTAEGEPFQREVLNNLVECAETAMKVVFDAQAKALNS
jgi:ribonuclease PH